MQTVNLFTGKRHDNVKFGQQAEQRVGQSQREVAGNVSAEPGAKVPAGLAQVYFGAGKPQASAAGFDAIRDLVVGSVDKAKYTQATEVISFDEYLQQVYEDPKLIRTSAQRIYDMIIDGGRKRVQVDGDSIYTYDFFKNPLVKADALSGMEKPIHQLVESVRGAAAHSGPEKRIILMVGPVGTAKTTLVDIMKRGLESYTRTDEGKLYSLQWDLRGEDGKKLFDDLPDVVDSPMNEDPFLVIPNERDPKAPNEPSPRQKILKQLNENVFLPKFRQEHGDEIPPYTLQSKGDLSPTSKDIYNRLMKHYGGDFSQVLKHVKAKKIALSETDRVGLTTFEPADEKSLRRGHLTGEVNLRELMRRGTDSDPHAFGYDGELPQGNRGIGHFDELLKIPKPLLYPLLTASEKKKFKPDKFPLISYDGLLIGTTNIPDWNKVKNDKHLEAIRSRIIEIEVPYNEKVDDEMGIYNKDFGKDAKELGIHVGPHAVWAASLWAVMSRLAPPPNGITLLQKALLYNGEEIKNYTPQKVAQMKKDVPEESLELLRGVSPRDVQDALSMALNHPDVIDPEEGYRSIDPFLVIDCLKAQLGSGGVSNLTKEERKEYSQMLADVETEVKRRIKKDVHRALAGDESDLQHLFEKYTTEVNAWLTSEKVKDEVNGRMREPDEAYMQAIESKLGVTDANRAEHRKTLMQQIGVKTFSKQEFTYKTDQNLRRALEEYMIDSFGDLKLPVLAQRGTAKKEDQEKIEVIKARLIKDFGYDDHTAEIALTIASDPSNRGTSRD